MVQELDAMQVAQGQGARERERKDLEWNEMHSLKKTVTSNLEEIMLLILIAH